jgi:hypothetical protein
MNPPDVPTVEADPKFPSGPWTGFFLQWWVPGRHPMEIELTFNDGRLQADGSDQIGPFTFQGDYDRADGKCRWSKQYTGKHQVTYTGVNEGEGIWGIWEIRALGGLFKDQGVFHIWPQGMTPTASAEATVNTYLSQVRARSLKRLIVLAICAALPAAIALLCQHFLSSVRVR